MHQKMELAKAREFGDLITDTFTFIRQNFKPLIKAFFVFCGFFMLGFIVMQCLQQLNIMAVTSSGFTDDSYSNTLGWPARFGIEYLLSMLFMLLTYTAMSTTVLSYMALYKEKGNVAPTLEELWSYIKYYFLRVLGGSIPLGILIAFGFAFCLLPGFWLYPIFGLVFPIMIFENASFGYAFNRSFTLIKNHWWLTFGALIIMVLIIYVGMIIFSLPSAAILVFNALTHTKNFTRSVPAVAFTTLLQGLGQVLFILPIVTLGLCYFNLNEIKEGTGLLDRINRFGTNTDTDLPAEEY